MGKRELLLVAAFLLTGVVVYQFTAPPPAAGERGFSLSRLVEGVRREIRGNRATAQLTHTTTRPAPPSLQEIRINLRGELHVTGEDREDIQASLKVTSRAYDDAEAQQTAKDTYVKFDDTGGTLTMSVEFPEPGQQTVGLDLRVPKRMRIRVDDKNGPFTLAGTADLEMGNSRGRTEISRVAGRVSMTQRGGAVTIREVGSLRLNLRGGAEATVAAVRGDSTFNIQAGDLRASDLGGAIEIESSSADVRLEKLQNAHGPLRITATAGSVELSAVRADTRIDGRNTEIRVEIDRPAPIAIYSEGDEPLTLTVPRDTAFKLDALARNAAIAGDGDVLQRWGITVEGAEGATEKRAAGAVRGGGPTIILRTNRGDISLRERERTATAEKPINR